MDAPGYGLLALISRQCPTKQDLSVVSDSGGANALGNCSNNHDNAVRLTFSLHFFAVIPPKNASDIDILTMLMTDWLNDFLFKEMLLTTTTTILSVFLLSRSNFVKQAERILNSVN